jgi:hypothetical protein
MSDAGCTSWLEQLVSTADDAARCGMQWHAQLGAVLRPLSQAVRPCAVLCTRQNLETGQLGVRPPGGHYRSAAATLQQRCAKGGGVWIGVGSWMERAAPTLSSTTMSP